MTPKLFKDVSASALQVVINQVLALMVFLITSVYLSKEDYGELNWSLAVFTLATTLLSLRLEQIVVRNSAAGHDPSKIMTLFMLHTGLSGTGFYLFLLLFNYIYPPFFTTHHLLLIVGISQLLSFFSASFKQIANGKERFDYLAIMSSTANLARVILLFIVLLVYPLTVQWVLIIFIISSILEWWICFFIVSRRMKIPFTRKINFIDYRNLLHQSLQQMGVAILMAGITRIDWILLGLFSTSVLTAEYSFAYRVYELSPFPLLIIAPVLLSRFSRFFDGPAPRSLLEKKNELGLLVRGEMIAATMIPLVLNIIWTPVIDGITDAKYGAVNQFTFLVLSFCIPFQYITNILWSAQFAQNRLKLIFRITLITFCIVVTGDLLFIPRYNVKGAALVYLVAMIVEYLNYMRSSELSAIKETWQSLLICILGSAGSGFAAVYWIENTPGRLLLAISLFFLVLLATRQLRLNDMRYMLRPFQKKNN